LELTNVQADEVRTLAGATARGDQLRGLAVDSHLDA
jgi:hypothetical protein